MEKLTNVWPILTDAFKIPPILINITPILKISFVKYQLYQLNID